MSVTARILGTIGAWAAWGSTQAAEVPGVNPWREVSGVGFSLVVVLVVIGAVAWFARRTPLLAGARTKGPLKVLATLPLGPRERIVLVEAGEMRLLIGVSQAGIFPLHGGAQSGDASSAGFRELLQKVN
jgi:flagellar protein FliO/FliZ